MTREAPGRRLRTRWRTMDERDFIHGPAAGAIER